jgi:hypothetical protein
LLALITSRFTYAHTPTNALTYAKLVARASPTPVGLELMKRLTGIMPPPQLLLLLNFLSLPLGVTILSYNQKSKCIMNVHRRTQKK